MRDVTARRLSTLHRMMYRASGGHVGKRFVNNDMLLLTTTGRRTGTEHTVPLLYLSANGDASGHAPLYVIASWGGRDNHPEWYLNLIHSPHVGVQLRGRRFSAVAAPLEEPDRTEWWQRAVTAYDGYRAYQTRTGRVIPVVRLEPT
jgi:deazaflavin-dependent oxidoreductase (nitroreductase family)